jgi:hypothetical protein
MNVEELVNAAHKQAVCQSGPRKGRLKANCPPMGTPGEAYWLGCMYELNPLRVSIARLIFMTPEHRELFDAAVASTKAVRAKSRKVAA